jgi:hypothetical protein
VVLALLILAGMEAKSEMCIVVKEKWVFLKSFFGIL